MTDTPRTDALTREQVEARKKAAQDTIAYWHGRPGNRGITEAVRFAQDIVKLCDMALTPPQPTADPDREDAERLECHKLDTPTQVFFYEQDFYVLSNFSAFRVHYAGCTFDTSEHAYHFAKFFERRDDIAHLIYTAPSAHEAFKCAEEWRDQRRPDWDAVKVGIMKEILRRKASQHEYVRRKLLATGDRELIEDSWRDDFWGWGPNRDGQNMLGKLWMEIRVELRAAIDAARAQTTAESKGTQR